MEAKENQAKHLLECGDATKKLLDEMKDESLTQNS